MFPEKEKPAATALVQSASTASDPETGFDASTAASVQHEGAKSETVTDTDHSSIIPDGGLEAWSVVAGGWLIMFATFGYMNSFGVYQAYYVPALHMSDSAVSWIGSFQVWLQFFVGIFVGKFFDEGYGRLLIFVGSVIWSFALFMTSLCKTYWQAFLAQGVLAGLGLGIVFLPAVGVVPHWFDKKRALATGIVMSGSSVGAVCFPIMLNLLFKSIGFANGVRASAGLALGCLVLANILVKPRLVSRRSSPSAESESTPDPRFQAIIKHPAYIFTIAGGFCVMWGLFYPTFYLQVFAQSLGVSEALAFYSLAILNGVGLFGRTLPAMFADRYGGFNAIIGVTMGAGVVLFAFVAVHDIAGVIAFAIFYGFFNGAFLSLIYVVLQSLSSHVGEMGIRLGLAEVIFGFSALTGTPIDGALLGGTASLEWWKPTVFSGATLLAGAALLVVARSLHARALGTSRV